MISYYRTTDDGRIVFGKGGWGIALGDRIGPRFDRDEGRARQVAQSFHEIYPMLADVPIATDWCGPIDRTRTGLPIFGHLGGRSHIVYGVGFSGNGVAPAVVGGRILSSLALGIADEWSACGLVDGRAGPLPARSRALPRRARGARGRGAQGGGGDGGPGAEPPGRRAREPRARGHDPEEVGVARRLDRSGRSGVRCSRPRAAPGRASFARRARRSSQRAPTAAIQSIASLSGSLRAWKRVSRPTRLLSTRPALASSERCLATA